MKETATIIVIVLVAVILSACSTNIPIYAEVIQDKLPLDSPNAGGYSEYFHETGQTMVQNEVYYWEPRNVNFLSDNCVRIGTNTIKITLSSNEGFHWEANGSEFCLKRD